MMMTRKIIAASAIIIASLAMIIPGFAIASIRAESLPLQTFQDENHIIITITKSGEPPQGPIVIVPPSPGNENGTILTPGENSTAENPGNVTIITPGGNVTEIPGNVTTAGNDTVIIAPPDRNITETPGNVTVIDPPAPQPQPPAVNQTAPVCTCNQTTPAIPPVLITPAPGQNVTTQQSPTPPIPAPSQNETTITTSNETNTTSTTNPAGNQTTSQNSTGTNATTTTTTTGVSLMFPGFQINKVDYHGVNNQWLVGSRSSN